ncbi:MAG: hypothetical protein KatS3mg111_1602 [Pirellulaceae bacterium]|nr:MAG: hypothetical protein KatS3mg111_1602 [Pirellulaceae bacterium]
MVMVERNCGLQWSANVVSMPRLSHQAQGPLYENLGRRSILESVEQDALAKARWEPGGKWSVWGECADYSVLSETVRPVRISGRYQSMHKGGTPCRIADGATDDVSSLWRPRGRRIERSREFRPR